MEAHETFFEFDLKETAGVSLTVEPGQVHGSTRFAVDVDGTGRAAYLGPDDTRALGRTLTQPRPVKGDPMKAVSPKMWKALRLLRSPGVLNRVEFPGPQWDGTIAALLRRGLIILPHGEVAITELGRFAYDSFVCGCTARANGWGKAHAATPPSERGQ